eukprot:TRINITY_DN1750_c0_g1_i11.p1 TRINITY_DN1750_c0_g1~~TRINITY_DN1750_c0_g1_i11.p1  ORF type:complete len:466 (-),score=139.86 TRINITY_DN1750_c0_g1_i11:87-1484(-)
MIRRPPRSTQSRSSAASDVYKRQVSTQSTWGKMTKFFAVAALFLVISAIQAQNIGFFRNKEALWFEAEELLQRDLRVMGKVQLSTPFRVNGIILKNVEARITSLNGDYQVEVDTDKNAIKVSNIKVTASMTYDFERRLLFLGIPLPLWLLGQSGIGQDIITSNITITKYYSKNETSGKPIIQPTISVAYIHPIESANIQSDNDLAKPLVTEAINNQLLKKLWENFSQDLNLYANIKYQHIQERYQTKFSYQTTQNREIKLDYSIMNLKVVQDGLFFGIKGVVEGGRTQEVPQIPRIDPSEGNVQVFMSKNFIRNLVYLGATSGAFQYVLNYQNADTNELDWQVGDWVRLIPQLRQSYNVNENLQAKCKIMQENDVQVDFNEENKQIVVTTNFNCEIQIEKTNKKILSLDINIDFRVEPQLKTDGNEEQGKRVYFKLIQAEIGKGGVKLPEFNLGEKEQNLSLIHI